MHDNDAWVDEELDNKNNEERNLKIWMNSEEIQKYNSSFFYLNINLQTDCGQAA